MPPTNQLCYSCPLRCVGTRLLSDVQPNDGAVALHRLTRGAMLDNEAVYGRFVVVRSGMLKVEYVGRDGDPELGAFLVTGDPVVATLSLEAVAITALEETHLCEIAPSRLDAENPRLLPIIRELLCAVGEQAAADQRRLITARSGSVRDRLFWFLKDIAARNGDSEVRLAMSRDDIAHYLETSSESVSRAFSWLAKSGRIERCRPRQISIRDDAPAGLKRLPAAMVRSGRTV